ncbi:alpha/beta hydrolase family protein [Tellurirhabdus bombi]|uniref:alpha/beta hydrolase family protein n=1 Tax=Tellurirhabdus bombi TaxID=2907205 RepID=UPI001F1E39A9|nr:prolyl oligopeptidase family serine peptidase [Tellurirhabdus bombi]
MNFICRHVLLLTALLPGIALAQDNQSYQTPPKAITDLATAPPTPSVSISPKNDWMLILERSDMPTIAELAAPELRIGGLRINPLNNGQSRALTYVGMKAKSIASQQEKAITGLPAEVRIADVSWSPDGKQIAFTVPKQNTIELWTVEVAAGTAKKLLEGVNDAIPGIPYEWGKDSQSLIVKLIDEARQQPPQAPSVPTGPTTQENRGGKAPSRTYQDLLKNVTDEALFDYHIAGKLVKVSLAGQQTPLLSARIVTDFNLSPNGQYLLTTTVKKPYSYLVPYSFFPKTIEVLDQGGKSVKVLAEVPLAENLPTGFDAVPTSMRSVNWRADAPATVYYVQAQDGGDPNKEAAIRDKVFLMPAPFTAEATELAALPLRYRGVVWGNDEVAMVSDGWWKTRKIRTHQISPAKPGSLKTLFDRNTEDGYANPGSPATKTNEAGRSVLVLADKGKSIFLIGAGASPEGNRPFVRKMNLDTKTTKEVFRSQAPYYEVPVEILDETKNIIITRRESVEMPPNYFVRNLSKKGDQQLTQLTSFPHPYPALKNIKKELIQYTRKDGVKLTAKLYLPEGYTKEKGTLPLLMWAYPREFKSADAAGQVKDSPYEFVRLSWGGPLFWLTQGYAVLDDPDLPIIGEGTNQPNDTYIEQLVSGAEAAVAEVVRRGVADPKRIGVGGHSYGAFMTANLLAHSDIFAAGIARSGAYNRTLTPFGFQSEERTFWEAPEVYSRMSPFNHANKLKEPILLVHGEADNNQGTFPIQSERFYNALKGHGGTARLVMLPYESHGYAAKESILHTLAEMNQWLDKYVKNRPTTGPQASKVSTGK